MPQLSDTQRQQLIDFIIRILSLPSLDGNHLIRQILANHDNALDDAIWRIEDWAALAELLASHLLQERDLNSLEALRAEVREHVSQQEDVGYVQMLVGLRQAFRGGGRAVVADSIQGDVLTGDEARSIVAETNIEHQELKIDPGDYIGGDKHVHGDTVHGHQTNIAGDINTGGGPINTGTINVSFGASTHIPQPNKPEPIPVLRQWFGRQIEIDQCTKELKMRKRVVITGPGGIGKTYLATALATHIQKNETKIFWHKFQESDEAYTIVNYLAECVASQGNDRLWNEIHNNRLVTSQSSDNALLDQRIRTLLSLLAADNYVVFLDDYHIIDPQRRETDNNPSGQSQRTRSMQIHDLIERLFNTAERVDSQLSLIIASRRPPDFVDEDNVYPLGGMSGEDSKEFLKLIGTALDQTIYQKLYEFTKGNPQHLTVLSSLHKRGDDFHWLKSQQIYNPAEIDRTLSRRFDRRLLSSERAILQSISIMEGRPISKDAIEEISGDDNAWDVLMDLMDEHVISGKKGRTGIYVFTIPDMLKDYYYLTRTSSRIRQRMHKRAGKYFVSGAEKNLSEALLHYYKASDVKASIALATDSTMEIFSQGHVGLLLDAFGQITSGHFTNLEDEFQARTAEGEVQARSGAEQKAIENFEQILEDAREQQTSKRLNELCGRVCVMLSSLLRRSAPQQAIDYAEKGLQFIAKIYYSTVRAELYLRKAQALIQIGDYSDGLQNLDKTEEHNKGDGKDFVRENILLGRAYIHMKQGDIEQAEKYYHQAYTLAESLKDLYGAMTARIQLANQLYYQGKWLYLDENSERRGAIAQNETSLEQARRLKSPGHVALLLNNLGFMYLNLGDFPTAIQYLQECIDLSKLKSFPHYSVAARSTLADLWLRENDAKEAHRLLQDAIKIAEEGNGNHAHQLPELNRNLARCFLAKGNLDEAKKCINLSIELACKVGDKGDPLEEGMSLRILGDIEVTTGTEKFKEIRSTYEQSRDLLTNDKYEYARSTMQLGRLCLENSDVEAGTTYLTAAQKIFQSLGAQYDLQIANSVLGGEK